MYPRTMKSLLTTAAGITLLLLAAMPARAQTGDDALRFLQRYPAVGPHLLGMAGATGSGVADASALFSNPAGLGFYRRSSFAGALNVVNATDDALFEAPGFTSTLENDVNQVSLGHLAYVYKVPTVRGSLVFGAAVNQINSYERELLFQGENASNSITEFFLPFPEEFDLVEEDGEVFPEFTRPLSFIAYETFGIDLEPSLIGEVDVPFLPAVTQGVVRQTGTVREEGSLREVSFGGATEAAENVMVGVSINVPFGEYRFTRVFEEDDFANDNDGTGTSTDFAGLRLIETFESDLAGINVRVGVSGGSDDGLRFGFAAETPTYYTVNEDYATELSTTFDNGDAFTYGDDFDEDAGDGGYEYQITSPWRLSGGVSYRLGSITVLADAEWLDWSGLELDADDFAFTDENIDIQRRFDDVVNVRVGGEYELGSFVVRGGYAFQPDPRNLDLIDPDGTLPNRDREYWSAGFSYMPNDQFALDFGWMQERYDDQYRPYTEVAEAPVVTEEVTRDRFALGVRVFF